MALEWDVVCLERREHQSTVIRWKVGWDWQSGSVGRVLVWQAWSLELSLQHRIKSIKPDVTAHACDPIREAKVGSAMD